MPGLPITVQGLLPKRHEELARLIGETVESQLLSIDQLLDTFDIQGYKTEVVETVVHHVDDRLKTRLPRMIPSQFRSVLHQMINDVVQRETAQLMDKLIDQTSERLRRDVRVGPLITERVLELDLEGLEQLVLKVASRELRAIEVLGAVLGFIIGVGQAFILKVVGAF